MCRAGSTRRRAPCLSRASCRGRAQARRPGAPARYNVTLNSGMSPCASFSVCISVGRSCRRVGRENFTSRYVDPITFHLALATPIEDAAPPTATVAATSTVVVLPTAAPTSTVASTPAMTPTAMPTTVLIGAPRRLAPAPRHQPRPRPPCRPRRSRQRRSTRPRRSRPTRRRRRARPRPCRPRQARRPHSPESLRGHEVARRRLCVIGLDASTPHRLSRRCHRRR